MLQKTEVEVRSEDLGLNNVSIDIVKHCPNMSRNIYREHPPKPPERAGGAEPDLPTRETDYVERLTQSVWSIYNIMICYMHIYYACIYIYIYIYIFL